MKAGDDADLRRNMASCAYDLGVLVRVADYLQTALTHFHILCKNSEDALLWLQHGNACIKTCELLFEGFDFDSSDAETDSEGDSVETKEQRKLLHDGIHAFRKVRLI